MYYTDIVVIEPVLLGRHVYYSICASLFFTQVRDNMKSVKMSSNFEELEDGSKFRIGGILYIKVPLFDHNGKQRNVIRVNDGDLFFFPQSQDIDTDSNSKTELRALQVPCYVIYYDRITLYNEDRRLVDVESGLLLTMGSCTAYEMVQPIKLDTIKYIEVE